MNLNRKTDNEQSSSCEVISKYFKQSKCVMDISSSDFQDKKCIVKGPKTTQKPTISKVRKTSKRIKGQKDIRTALKPKKNELLTYTKEFDKVCKQSGLDVDSEQLQLAVALSKSLQKIDNLEDYNAPNSSLNSQDRTGNIRTTLQEYGFTIPEIKITKHKRFKKHKRNYKLLTLSEQDKQQTISDKYAQVLFQNVYNYKVANNQFDYSDKELYYKATSISYKEMQTNDLLYVDNLIKKSTSTGSLLRSWENIPGRPKSPTNCETLNMNFSEIECSQDELDIVLSGSLKTAKDVVKNKVKIMSVSAPVIIADATKKYDDILLSDQNSFKKRDSVIVDISNDQNIITTDGAVNNKTLKNLSSDSSILDKQSLTVRKITRSCSPDIFDDEVSTILNTSEENKDMVYSELINSIIEDNNKSNLASQKNVTNRKSNDMMEITECAVVSVVPDNVNIDKRLQLSQGTLTTTKSSKYDDFIEITDCVPIDPFYKPLSQANSSKQPDHSNNKTKRISNDFMEITECVANTTKCKYAPVIIEKSIDLTQDSIKDNEMTVVDSHLSIDEVQNISLTSSGDELPAILIDRSNNKSLDETILLNHDEINNVLQHTPIQNLKKQQIVISTNEGSSKSENYNLPVAGDKECYAVNANQSFFDEFVHNHSDDTIETNTALISNSMNNDGGIDLTQSSGEAIENKSESFDPTDKVDNSIISKQDDVSIDYDELYDDVLQRSKDTHSNIYNLSQQSIVSNTNENNLTLSKASSDTSNQNSGVLEFSDQELNYSINKSRHEVPWENFGGVSVLDDISKLEYGKISDGVIKRNSIEPNSASRNSMSDSFLPVVDIKSNVTKAINAPSKECIATPKNYLAKIACSVVNTPSSDYIIKTDQVTPMLDYASMSTPERNRELDKYGLKPFKRKRAIQLLTHLYNQTHPIVQSSQEILSPSKKRKHSQPSPRKSLESHKQNANDIVEFNKENNLYELTKELPDITAIDCLEEDWVFQKREKAKIPSCRLPLHIAFHNYVSCRQRLREAILRYEPVNIDDIHKGLVAIGCRYDPKELLKFMDKKCITVKTADNNARNKRY